MVKDFSRSMQLHKGEVYRFRGFVLYVREDFPAYRQRSYECGCYEIIVVRIFSSSHNFYVLGVYRNLYLSDNIFYCLLTAMAKVQSDDRKASYFFCWCCECSS